MSSPDENSTEVKTMEGENQMNPLIQLTRTILPILIGVALVSFPSAPARATPSNPIVSSLFVPIEGNVTEPGTTNVVHLTSEVHVLTQVTFSETGVPAVQIWANLVRVRGTSEETGITYLGVGASNTNWVGINPGPPDIPEQQLTFTLVSLETQPGPPTTPPNPVLPVFLGNFVFGVEDTNFGQLQTVDASFG
jgi:hypothetical protein